MTHKQRIVSTALIALVAVVLLILPEHEQVHSEWHTDKGKVFGTYYSIQYDSKEDLHDSILAAFDAFDASLSMFNCSSIIAHINNGTDSVTDRFFVDMYRTAEDINERSHGAFDITVAPLVNLWGFGLKNKQHVTPEQVDSLMKHIGMQKTALVEQSSEMYILRKYDTQVQLDAGAIAKGQSCDMIAALLERHGCSNYLVDIGGEVVAHGTNSHQQPWRIGITRPIDDASGTINEVEKVLESTDIALATSGNYRNFYYDGEQKRSHTIDPRTGYPVQHSMLSATVRSRSCMRADALATACMVLGADEALAMIEQDSVSACLLILAGGEQADSIVIRTSSRWTD